MYTEHCTVGTGSLEKVCRSLLRPSASDWTGLYEGSRHRFDISFMLNAKVYFGQNAARVFLLANFFLAVGILGFACYLNLFEMMLLNRGPQSLLLRWPDCSWFQPSSRDAASLLNSSHQFFFHSKSFSDLLFPSE